jgi:tetratricopeptide (TPR) repeat protein
LAARPALRIAKVVCELNFDADRWLALYANRRGSYADAIKHLKGALAATPEDPAERLNLVVNLIFRDNGEFGEEARTHARVAIFNGGPEARVRFRLRLANTANRDALCRSFEDIFEHVKHEWEAWRERRRKIQEPEWFGQALHFEWRP